MNRGFYQIAESYRFGYQGSEKDSDVNGTDNTYTTHFRMLDTRLGRWFSVDPVYQPWQSPYTSMDNNPISLTDAKGDCPNCLTAIGGGVLMGGIELGGQLLANGGDFNKVDWVDVAVETGKGVFIGSGAGLAALPAVKYGGDAVKASFDLTIEEGNENIFNGDKKLTDAGIDLVIDVAGGKLLDKNVVGSVETTLKKVVSSEISENAVEKATKTLVKETANVAKQVVKDPSIAKQSTQSTVTRLASASENLNIAKATQLSKDVIVKPIVTTVKVASEAVENKVSEGVKWVKSWF